MPSKVCFFLRKLKFYVILWIHITCICTCIWFPSISVILPLVEATVNPSPHVTFSTLWLTRTPVTLHIPVCTLKSPTPNWPYLLQPNVCRWPQTGIVRIQRTAFINQGFKIQYWKVTIHNILHNFFCIKVFYHFCKVCKHEWTNGCWSLTDCCITNLGIKHLVFW